MSKIKNIIKSIIALFFAMFLFGCMGVESHTHTYSSNWSYNEQQHGHRCTFKNCTSTKDVAKHEFLSSYIKEKPTHIKKGIKAYKCKVCKYEKTEEIDTLKEHTYTKIEKYNSLFHKLVCA